MRQTTINEEKKRKLNAEYIENIIPKEMYSRSKKKKHMQQKREIDGEKNEWKKKFFFPPHSAVHTNGAIYLLNVEQNKMFEI